jgi:hypothetical protein
VDPTTGKRIQIVDPETNELIDDVDDRLMQDAIALSKGQTTDTLRFINREDVSLRCAVPVYYDRRYHENFQAAIQTAAFAGFNSATLGQLVDGGFITIRGGHGSPSQEERIGDVPYIKVSDLRAGLVNINPTNRVPIAVARSFWGSDSSGLRAFDLVCPERTSKNIGDFCILLPGQEQVVMTKEVIIIRPGPNAEFDSFYLLWALSLKIVRNQWKRVVFMQTNREDVGKRYLEVELPLPTSFQTSEKASHAFREYYLAIANARENLIAYLKKDDAHHFFVSGAEPVEATEVNGPLKELDGESESIEFAQELDT